MLGSITLQEARGSNPLQIKAVSVKPEAVCITQHTELLNYKHRAAVYTALSPSSVYCTHT